MNLLRYIAAFAMLAGAAWANSASVGTRGNPFPFTRSELAGLSAQLANSGTYQNIQTFDTAGVQYWHFDPSATSVVNCDANYVINICPGGTVTSGAWVSGVYADVSFELFGALGDAQRRYDCTVTSGSAIVSCSGYVFTARDVGKVIAARWSGAVVAGEQTRTFISTITSISAGNAVMTANATTTPNGPSGSGPAFVYFGTDNTNVLQTALTARLGTGSCLTAKVGANYLVTGPLTWGGAADVAHCFKLNNAGIISVLGSNAAYNTTTDNNTASGVGAPSNGTYPGMSFWPLHFENAYFDCADTGRDCFTLGNSSQTNLTNFKVNNSYRNGFAVKPTTGWVDGLNLNTFIVMNSGLHAFYANLNSTYNPYFNVLHAATVELNTFSLNGCAILAAAGGPACSWSSWSGGDMTTYNIQLGAAMYFINLGTSGPISYHTYSSIGLQANSPLAQYWGSNINPNAVVYADGTQSHLIEGAGNPSASLGVKGFSYNTVDTEDPNDFSAAAGGSNCFRAESVSVGAAISLHNVANHVPSAYCGFQGASWGNKNGSIYQGVKNNYFFNSLAGDVFLGDSGATTSTAQGMVWMQGVAGTPTSTPASNAGYVPFLFDTTDNVPCFYSTIWRCGFASNSGADFNVGQNLVVNGYVIQLKGNGTISAIPGFYVQGTTEYFIPPTTGFSWNNATNTLTLATLSNSGAFALPQIASDATHTDATACVDTTSKTFLSGSGTLGVCLGTSRRSFKQNIVPMGSSLAGLEKLPLYHFNYKPGHGYDPTRRFNGPMVEDVAKVFPDCARNGKDGKPLQLDALCLGFHAMRAQQEMQKEIVAMRSELRSLNLRVERPLRYRHR